jgi:hypothetical protein
VPGGTKEGTVQQWRPWLMYGIVFALLVAALIIWNTLRAGYVAG